jgi:hypothetical protein
VARSEQGETSSADRQASQSPARRFPTYAVAALGCAICALAWVRACALFNDDLMGIGITVWMVAVPVVLVRGVTLALRVGWRARPVVMGVTILVVATLSDWVAQVGGYAIPHPASVPLSDAVIALTEPLGMLLCFAALMLGASSLLRRERAIATAIASMAAGLFVLTTAFVYDAAVGSPYWVVRQYARAAYRCDQEAMNQLLSRESLAHYPELLVKYFGPPRDRTHLVTVDHMYGVVAAHVLLPNLKIDGDCATVRTDLPRWWSIWHFRGKGGHIYLVREQGRWRIDAYRHLQELLQRWEEDEAPSESG